MILTLIDGPVERTILTYQFRDSGEKKDNERCSEAARLKYLPVKRKQFGFKRIVFGTRGISRLTTPKKKKRKKNEWDFIPMLHSTSHHWSSTITTV